MVAKTWTEDGTYIDAHRRDVSHQGIEAMIKTAQDMFPGYQLRLVSGIEAHNGYVRFSWAAGGSPEAPLYLGGTDFAIVGRTAASRWSLALSTLRPRTRRSEAVVRRA